MLLLLKLVNPLFSCLSVCLFLRAYWGIAFLWNRHEGIVMRTERVSFLVFPSLTFSATMPAMERKAKGKEKIITGMYGQRNEGSRSYSVDSGLVWELQGLMSVVGLLSFPYNQIPINIRGMYK